MTFFVGALDKTTGIFRYAKASHNPPVLIRKGVAAKCESFPEFRKTITYLSKPNGSPLGYCQDQQFEENSLQLQAGDKLVFYTDGLTELENKDSKMWGERGFLTAIYEALNNGLRSSEIIKYVIDKAKVFRGNSHLKDDITLCVLQYKGSDEKEQPKTAPESAA
jgi:phosphoserine phosphatase RsbU/P